MPVPDVETGTIAPLQVLVSFSALSPQKSELELTTDHTLQGIENQNLACGAGLLH
jgi:hypothetical protein